MKLEKNASGLEPRPMVGVGVMVENSMGQYLMGLRKGSHGADLWAFPGGHLEFGDTLIETAGREVLEETGLIVGPPQFVSIYEDLSYIATDGKHFVDFTFKAAYLGGTPQRLEPEKCLAWEWISPNNLPLNTYTAALAAFRAAKLGSVFVPHVKK